MLVVVKLKDGSELLFDADHFSAVYGTLTLTLNDTTMGIFYPGAWLACYRPCNYSVKYEMPNM